MKKLILLFFVTTSCYAQAVTLDLSFDTDGKVVTPIAKGLNSIYDIALQSDGKIVAVGYALTGINYDMAIARYNPDGSLDLSFNFVGFDVVDFGFPDDIAYGVSIQSDGKIVAVGSAGNGSNTDFGMVRYNTDGSLDNTFDVDGMVTTTFSTSYESAYDVAIQTDGKIVVGGAAFIDTTYTYGVARYNTNGSLDATFGSGGKATVLVANNDEARAIAIQSDGKIVLAGTSMQPDFSRGFGIVRLNTNGTLDAGFNGTGKVFTSVSPNNDFAQAVTLQSDGKIVVAGKATPVGPEQFALVRYNTNGSLDNSFDTDGMLTTAFGSTWDEARAAVVQPDGKIIAGGLATISGQKFAMARYNTDGSLDASFGVAGKLTTTFGSSASIWAMAIQADQKILAAGYSGTAANYDFALARYGPSEPGSVADIGILENGLMAYPNPFDQQITIEYNLLNMEETTIQLIDQHGKVVKTFISGQVQEAGMHQQILQMPQGLSNAAYILLLTTPTGSASVNLIQQ